MQLYIKRFFKRVAIVLIYFILKLTEV